MAHDVNTSLFLRCHLTNRWFVLEVNTFRTRLNPSQPGKLFMKKKTEPSGVLVSANPAQPGPRADALLQILVETVKDYAIILLDTTGHVLTWNAAAQRLEGWSANEIIGQHFSKFYPPEDVQRGKTETELRVAEQEGRFEDEGWCV